MLTIENLNVSYGAIEAIKGISLEVPEGKIVTLIGANGAGKSTTLKGIMGLVKPSSGSITFKGKNLLQIKTQDMVAEGITLVPEGRHVFPDMSVLENLKIGAFKRQYDAEFKKDLDWVYEIFPILKDRTKQLSGTLSGGEQQMLAIARGLMCRPTLMMMDEPSLGLAPLIVKDMFRVIKEVNETGVTILLVEQNANSALHLADTGYVLETGRITLSGTGHGLLADENVKKAYLGELRAKKERPADEA